MNDMNWLNVADFARFPRAYDPDHIALRSTTEVRANGDDRRISFIFSDASVARDGHTIATDGWLLNDFKANPVFLWCHDTSSPPIGRVVSIGASGSQLLGTVEYASRDVYEFADTIYQLTKAGYLNAVSVSWLPTKWKMSTDKNRPRGAIDFLQQELLEISAVPVPALPTALATARAAGIDTGPLYTWAEKVLDDGGMIMIPRSDLEMLRKEAKMPTQRAKDETAIAPADKPVPVVEPKVEPAVVAVEKRIGKRSLYQVSWLAMILGDLGYLQMTVEDEAAYEGDGSTVPAQLADALKSLGQTLIDMTVEEVTELVGELEDITDETVAVPSEGPGEQVVYENAFKMKRAAFQLLRQMNSFNLPALITAMDATAKGRAVSFKIDDKPVETRETREGKSLSSKNERVLRDAHDMMSKGCDMVRGVFEAEEPADDGSVVQTNSAVEGKARDIRQRRAKALKLKTSLA